MVAMLAGFLLHNVAKTLESRGPWQDLWLVFPPVAILPQVSHWRRGKITYQRIAAVFCHIAIELLVSAKEQSPPVDRKGDILARDVGHFFDQGSYIGSPRDQMMCPL